MRFLAAAGLVMILTGLGAYYATERELSLFSIANLVAGPVLLVLAGIAQMRSLRGFSGHFSRMVALRWTIIGLAVVAVGVGANALATGWGAAIDLTVERTYTLSEQTRKVCASSAALNGPKPELLLFEHTHIWREVVPLIEAYRQACPGLPVRQLSPADAPAPARPILARGEATVLVCLPERCEWVGFPSEENITTALLRATRHAPITAYFLLGHGEVNLADDGNDGFSKLAEVLQAEGVALRGWIGPARESVPADADLVIIAAPERDLLPAEVQALDAYLRSGGRLLALLAPGTDTNLETLLEEWGFGLPAGIVVDEASSPLLEEPLAVSLIVNSFTPLHPITENMSPRTMLLVPTARPVFVTRKPEPSDEIREVAFSSRRSWVEQDVDSAVTNRPIQPDPGPVRARRARGPNRRDRGRELRLEPAARCAL
jgi:hypothetical protein